MPSESQLNANRSNAKKSTGPKTKSGKSVASSNAMKHGATSKQLISPTENIAYQTFLSALQKAYPNKNPLVAMQLERIAKIKIQLDRIQSTIDATFTMGQQEENVDSKLMELLDMDEALKNKAKSIASSETDILETVSHDRLNIASELVKINIEELKTHQDFLNIAPKLCQYLFKMSHKCASPIRDVIDLYSEQEVKDNNASNRMLAFIIKASRDASLFDSEISLEEAIQQVPVDKLRKVATLYSLEFHRLANTHYKITSFNRLREIPLLPIELNLDTLDKLYRYQSTLQRQLSNCIGELLVLSKA
jgi:hypothetical protein